VGVSVLGGYLYALGGHDAPASQDCSKQFDSVERYDSNTDQWTMIAPMLKCRDAVGVSWLGDRLYAIGGFDGTGYWPLIPWLVLKVVITISLYTPWLLVVLALTVVGNRHYSIVPGVPVRA